LGEEELMRVERAGFGPGIKKKKIGKKEKVNISLIVFFY
jgi:hypothetical protein